MKHCLSLLVSAVFLMSATGAEEYPRDAAEKFAAKILAAAALVGDEYVEKVSAATLVDRAIRGLYAGLPQKIPDGIEARLKNIKKEKDLKALVTDVRVQLGKNQALDGRRDLTLAMNGMLSGLDPYSSFIPDPPMFNQPVWPPAGVGLQLAQVMPEGVEVLTPVFASPAHRAGIRARDVITSITNLDTEPGKPVEKPETVSLKGKTVDLAARLLQGQTGASVRVTVRRPGAEKLLSFDVVRGAVKPETIFGARRNADGSWDYWLDAERKFGYVRVGMFSAQTPVDFRDTVTALKAKGARGVIVDLRFCPGGLLRSAVQMAELFVGNKVIVSVKARVGEERSFPGEGKATWPDLPLVCLVNEESKSSAEILAACLQDHGRAVIVGSKSFGKGSVQSILPFEMSQIKLTTATFQRPSGKTLNRLGVSPEKDDTVEMKDEERLKLQAHLRGQEIIPPAKAEKFTDRQLERARAVLEKKK